MKNWQDYATDAGTNRSKLSPPQPTISPQSNTSDTTSIKTTSKIWLGLNIALTSLCIVALIVGFINALLAYQRGINDPNFILKKEDSLFSLTIEHIAILFSLPGTWLFYIYLLFTGQGVTNGSGVVIMGIFVSGFLGLALIVNAFTALMSCFWHRRTKASRFYRRNLLFATIPPIFVITVLIILLFLPLITLPNRLT